MELKLVALGNEAASEVHITLDEESEGYYVNFNFKGNPQSEYSIPLAHLHSAIVALTEINKIKND